jgi:hypothetical protein
VKAGKTFHVVIFEQESLARKEGRVNKGNESTVLISHQTGTGRVKKSTLFVIFYIEGLKLNIGSIIIIIITIIIKVPEANSKNIELLGL